MPASMRLELAIWDIKCDLVEVFAVVFNHGLIQVCRQDDSLGPLSWDRMAECQRPHRPKRINLASDNWRFLDKLIRQLVRQLDY